MQGKFYIAARAVALRNVNAGYCVFNFVVVQYFAYSILSVAPFFIIVFTNKGNYDIVNTS